MQLIIFILIEYCCCLLSYCCWKLELPFMLLLFASPFYLSLPVFFYFTKLTIASRYKEKLTALYTGVSFYLFFILFAVCYNLTGLYASNDFLFMAMPVMLSFIPFFLVNKWPQKIILLFVIISALFIFLFCKYDLSGALFFFDFIAVTKADPVVLDFLAAAFVMNSLLMILSTFYCTSLLIKTGRISSFEA